MADAVSRGNCNLSPPPYQFLHGTSRTFRWGCRVVCMMKIRNHLVFCKLSFRKYILRWEENIKTFLKNLFVGTVRNNWLKKKISVHVQEKFSQLSKPSQSMAKLSKHTAELQPSFCWTTHVKRGERHQIHKTTSRLLTSWKTIWTPSKNTTGRLQQGGNAGILLAHLTTRRTKTRKETRRFYGAKKKPL